ncbi:MULTISPECIES: AfsR/SARP family transcriptional regulator [Nocardioides]|uniref:BTAD domain-containing putative transcriptional regulator n=1 Tax=Nocardioides vastitatis TaxID=2568655 RepID=A0ABW0ZJ06_9ACTN|nr:BTAD domain-containing putative transcriptional regulator [Nocardioides sp.]THI96609.1 DNA-binding protein [Nocardioides sp.]
MLARTRIQVCGQVFIELCGRTLDAGLLRGQGRVLFVYLVLNRVRALPRGDVVTALWPDEAPAAAQANLRVLVSRLRGVLGADAVEGRSNLRLVLPQDAWVDIEVAARKIHEAEAAVAARDWSRALPAASTAFTVSQRGFLPGADPPWAVERRRWLEDVQIRALECDGIASLGIGGSEIAAAERDGRRLLELAPYRESGYRLLMEALANQGNTAEALLVYERLRTVLRDELGTSPSVRSQALHRRLLQRLE